MRGRRVLLVGFGGVGRAFLSLLLRHRLGQESLAGIEHIFVLDRDTASPPQHDKVSTLSPADITSAEMLGLLLNDHEITDVVELAYVGTFDCVQVCAAAGVNYLSTSLETWPEAVPDRSAPHNLTLPDARRLLAGSRPATPAASHLIGAGMNPGVVNALALVGTQRFAHAAAMPPADLDICAVTVTEVDTTTRAGPSTATAPVGFPCTWSPMGCLDELHEPSSMIVASTEIVDLGHAPLAARYRARCGGRSIVGHAVPHDEQVTLGAHFPHAEVAFVYQLPPAARAFLANPPPGEPETFAIDRMYPPHHPSLQGSDTVGVVLTSQRHGEFWIGFETDCADALEFDTNATLLQVAAGVLAGFRQLGEHAGIHTVEDLDVARYVADVEQILGPATAFFDADVAPQDFAQRRTADAPLD